MDFFINLIIPDYWRVMGIQIGTLHPCWASVQQRNFSPRWNHKVRRGEIFNLVCYMNQFFNDYGIQLIPLFEN